MQRFACFPQFFSTRINSSHGVFALNYFLLFTLVFIMIAFGTKGAAIKRLSVSGGITTLPKILILPITVLVLSVKVGLAFPELIEALIISAWTVFMSAKLIALVLPFSLCLPLKISQ